jgi:hypothetical protein
VIELLCTDYNKKATSIHYYFGNAVLVLLTVIWNQNQSRYIKILSLKNYLSRISQSDLGLAS